MAKRTAVIDLGSNSIRLVIFEKTSRYAFHILGEFKRKVRLGENAYNNGKILQVEAMQRAKEALEYFKQVALSKQCRKILVVGTSALRDAPNAKEFIKEIKSELKLNIRCIDGKTESYFGGLAALNLISNIKNATTLDIGGGSSELCLIKEGKIVECISLDIGTVRLKELFWDKKKIDDAQDFLKPMLKLIPKHFYNNKLIAIGGSLRAISNAIMQKNSYPLRTLHEFSFKLKDEKKYIQNILKADNEALLDFGIKKDRLDTIKEGAFIFLKIADKLEAKEIITSGVGVREGVYLNDILPASKKFPPTFNPSVRSLQDRFLKDEECKAFVYCAKLFDALKPLHKLDEKFKNSLINAAKLYKVGALLNPYYVREHSFYFVLNALNYNFSHEEKVLIATLIRFHGKKINNYFLNDFKKLLPDTEILTWLNFILALASVICKNYFAKEAIDFSYSQNVLYIYTKNKINIPKDELKKIPQPYDFALVFNQKPI